MTSAESPTQEFFKVPLDALRNYGALLDLLRNFGDFNDLTTLDSQVDLSTPDLSTSEGKLLTSGKTLTLDLK